MLFLCTKYLHTFVVHTLVKLTVVCIRSGDREYAYSGPTCQERCRGGKVGGIGCDKQDNNVKLIQTQKQTSINGFCQEK